VKDAGGPAQPPRAGVLALIPALAVLWPLGI
jgi:hypothetical protein